MIRKRYQLNYLFECPDAVLTCSVLKCKEKYYLVFGGHDKTLYLMDDKMRILDDRIFDGWCRCSFTIDIDGDGCEEVLVGAGDGSFLVLKLSPEKKKLVGIMRYKSPKRVNCCIGGDFTRNGNIELLFGSEDKTVKLFDSIKAKEPRFIFYYDSWVTSCTLGFLKLPEEQIPIFGLLVGTKNGTLQLIRFKDEAPEIIWQKNFHSQINDIKVGDVTNNGLNEIILSTDEATIQILDVNGKIIKKIETLEGRSLSLLIEDIDGDNAKEIVAGCADGSLKIFHNPSLNSTDFELKWKTKVSTSIKDICYQSDREQKKSIVFGGYDRTIRNITDFEWGEKPILDIPQKLQVPIIEATDKESIIEEIAKAEEVPTNIREHLFKFLLEKHYLNELVKELKDLGYSEDEILDEIALLKTQKSVQYEKIEYPVWTLPEEEREVIEQRIEPVEGQELVEEPKTAVKHMVIEEPVKIIDDKEKLRAAFTSESMVSAQPEKKEIVESLGNVILTYLKEKGLVSTKLDFLNDIVAKGFGRADIEKEINLLKEKGKIRYSRAKPKGWSLND
ncbi:MAG: hypothetical protein ACFFCI_04975 [Promethearchaeota archaeon]